MLVYSLFSRPPLLSSYVEKTVSINIMYAVKRNGTLKVLFSRALRFVGNFKQRC